MVGTGDLPNFFRTPYGPSWALVGDAGYHRDPLTAQGISDAFRDAQLLSEAIDAGLAGRQPLPEALARLMCHRHMPFSAWARRLPLADVEAPVPYAIRSWPR